MRKLFEKVENFVQKSGKILIVSHRKPDADTLGAAIAMSLWMGGMGKSTQLACIDKPGAAFSFLPCIAEFKTEFDLNDFDLMIIVDAGASYMTNFHLKYPDFFTSKIPLINIDHHASNDNFGDLNVVDPDAASATVLIYRMFMQFGVVIDEKIATCLLAGIYGDTGSFMHSNTSEEVYDIASHLMKCGASIGEISKSLFKTTSVNTLKLWGKVLQKAHVTEDNVVMSVIREDDYDPAEASESLSGAVDYLNMVPGSKFAVLVNEDRKGNVKGSFRTRNGDVDLSRIAAVFGGGGHPKASGFSLPGHLKKEVRYTIVSDDMSKKSLDF